jgi:glycosyltransferase involved in cell wall biosynthesis
MANYNKEKFLREAIQSVLDQTFRDIELIVVDDASTDNSKAILDELAKKDSRIKVLFNNSNMGPSYSRNRALKIAKGGYICFVDSDDVIRADRLQKMIAAIDGKPDHVAYTHIRLIDEKGNPMRRIPRESRNFPPEGESRDYILREWIWASSTFMIPRSAVKNVGYFDESLRWGEDLNYLIRLTERYKVSVIREPLYGYRFHKNRVTSSMNPGTKDLADIGILELVLKREWDDIDETTRYWIIIRILRTHRLLHVKGKVRWLLSPFFIRMSLHNGRAFDAFIRTLREDMGEVYHKLSNRREIIR